ncbi:LysR family transcriptional regulator [Orrella daihaiensis]|uniref:LysR family transcriptional regulator n=1 Tax=Orrella daihaiensis TaxID=2782176 RepID=A0ABY4AJY5_9BURK|nr:LysR family transcriptional regulator [Orrella daihaiensis]UOD50268.1 LysR family transcriptional regulator [Orrella daihaiensis]
MNKIRAPRVTFNQLRTLEAVVRLGSVTRAAQELHLTQPTVSTQIQDLQASLDTELLEPIGRGIRPTEIAGLLRQTVLDIFVRWQQFEEELQAVHGLERGTLKIAGVTTTEYFIAQWLSDYTADHPGIEIELAVENRDAVVRYLTNDEIELAVMMMPPQQLPLETLPVMQNPLVLIGPKDHPWSKKSRLTRQVLDGVPMLMREKGSGTRLTTQAYFKQYGLDLNVRATLGSNEAIKHAVAAGLGLAVVSLHALAADPTKDGVAILPVTGFPIKRQWQLVWRKDRRLSLAARRFISDVRGRYQLSRSANHTIA